MKYIILDCDYLCHRAKYTTGSLSYETVPTGIIYGFLRSLSSFQDLFDSCSFVFCWDSHFSYRRKIYPEYKAHRDRLLSEDEMIFEQEFQRQMKKLRTIYLSMIGFENVFIQRGYESDDIIASLCRDILLKSSFGEECEAIIVSSDKDLYQCVSASVSIYNPQKGKLLTLQGFKKLYGILPNQWAMVKAIAGCATDNVKGIRGVGEKTAIRYLLGKLTEGTKYFDITCPMGEDIIAKNLPLVCLPMEGTNEFKLRKDNLSEEGWREVSSMLGMKSLRNKIPFGDKRK